MGGGEYQARWRNYVNATISANDMMSWAQTGASGATGDKRWKFRKVALWQCYSARVAGSSTTAGAGLYGNWHNAFGISPYQMNTLSGKNAGLFFNDDVFFTGPQGKNQYYPYGNPPADSAEVAAEFDKIWVMGANPFPGAADPNYSIQFAFGVVRNLYSPGFDKTAPVLIGCPFVPFAGVYDYQLMQGDYSQVKP
jgi:hypothetical protein